jgi:RNA polymerase sigma factor (sigma-70 family)
MTEAAAPGPPGGRVAGLPLRGPARLLSDERLARRATSGDRRAFEEIFRRYHQDLYRFCLATVSNPQDAQEALQNTMVKVMRALPGEQREIKLKPWLFRIARNEAVETMRKRRDTVELGAERIASSWEITDAADARERLRELFTDLAELPERQRSALVMRELAGLDFAEIGETFGTSAAVARQTLYEARQSLRQMDEGREMTCAHVQQAISDADGRVTRRRDIRAHLRDCVECRGFRDGIARRRQDFAAVAPLPAAVSAGLLEGVLSGEATGAALAAGVGGATSGSVGGAVGVGVGKAVVGSTLVKSVATVAVVAAVGAGAADRSGLVDLPRPGGDGGAAPGADGRPAGSGGGADGARDDGTSAARTDASAADVAARRGGKGKGNAVRPAKERARSQRRGRPPHAAQGGPPAAPASPGAQGRARAAEPPASKGPPPLDGGQPPASAGRPADVPPAELPPQSGETGPPEDRGGPPPAPAAPPAAADGAATAPSSAPSAPPAGKPQAGAESLPSGDAAEP